MDEGRRVGLVVAHRFNEAASILDMPAQPKHTSTHQPLLGRYNSTHKTRSVY